MHYEDVIITFPYTLEIRGAQISSGVYDTDYKIIKNIHMHQIGLLSKQIYEILH